MAILGVAIGFDLDKSAWNSVGLVDRRSVLRRSRFRIILTAARSGMARRSVGQGVTDGARPYACAVFWCVTDLSCR